MEVSCKIGGTDLDSLQLTFLRFAIGGLVLLPFAIAQMRRLKIKLTAKDLLALAGVGFLGVTISMTMFQLSIMMCNASTVSVLICINPFFTMIFAHFLTSEKINRYRVLILMIALIGIVFMLRPWDIQEGNSVAGMMLMIGAAFFFGLYTVTGKVSQEKIGLMAQTSISFLFGAAALLIIILIMGRPVLSGVIEDLPVVLYTGVLVTGLGYYCYFKAIELTDALTGSFAFFLKPAIAPVIAVIVLHEAILWNTVLGIGFVLAASLLNIVYTRKRDEQRFNEEYRIAANENQDGIQRKNADRIGELSIDRTGEIDIDKIRDTFGEYVSVGEHSFNHFAVLVPIVSSEAGLSLLYEVRAKKLNRQPGEICFPGGLIEEGETPRECALRETYEEIGIKQEDVEVITEFDSVTSTSGSRIHSFIGIIKDGAYETMTPSEDEVAEVFTVAIDKLLSVSPEIYNSEINQVPDPQFPYDRVTGGEIYNWRNGRSPVPVYDLGGRIIWGLTGRITKQFLEVLRDE